MTTTSRRWLWIVGLGGLLALLGAGAYAFRFAEKAEPKAPSARPPDDPADIVEQVHNFCGAACHAYPPPDTFPRKWWRKEVERGFLFFEKSGLPRKAPPIESVVRYYEKRAPEELAVPTWKTASWPLGVRFERRSYPGPSIEGRFAISNVNLVHLPDPGKPARGKGKAQGPLDVLACDMQAGLVMLLRPSDPSPAWKVLANHAVNKLAPSNPAHAEVIDLNNDGTPGVLVADLGSFPPTDDRRGRVVWLRGESDGSFTPITLLEKVGRVADVQAADFRGVGKLDLVVAVFGWQTTGEILYMENHTLDPKKPKFVTRVLDRRHGTIHVPVADLNGDSKPDFVALIAQEHETVVAFINKGKGQFEQKVLYEAPHPGYGSSGIQLVDLNGDGKLDVLYTNGDILDDPYLLKPYHSVQWLENKGDLNFEHHPLTPMYGTHRAVAGDLLGTGRQAVVAVSFLPHDKFPERRTRKADAIVVLEQLAPGKGEKAPRWERHSLATVDCDHVTCAVGDVYGTGRQDVVVGNFSSTATNHPVTIWKNLGLPKEEKGRSSARRAPRFGLESAFRLPPSE